MSIPSILRAASAIASVMWPSALLGRVVADPTQAIVGDPRRAAAAVGDFAGRRVLDIAPAACLRCGERSRSARRDCRNRGARGSGSDRAAGRDKQAAARRCADHGERPQLHVHGPRAGAFAERDVDAKVFHRRVHELLDRFGQPMDFVDEQNRTLLGVREVRQQILRSGEGGTAGDLQRDAEIARNAGGERRFAEARADHRAGCGRAALCVCGRHRRRSPAARPPCAGRPSRSCDAAGEPSSSSRSLRGVFSLTACRDRPDRGRSSPEMMRSRGMRSCVLEVRFRWQI